MADVLLRATNPALYHDNGHEPQYVTAKEPQNGWIYLDSKNSTDADKTNCQIVSRTPLIQQANRIRVAGIGGYFPIPNVNPRNNVISFWSSITNSVWSVTLTERYYAMTDVAVLIADIIVKLNSVSGGSGLTFASVAVTGFPNTYNINAASGTFYWDRNSSAVIKGSQMYGLVLAGAATSQRLSPPMVYTNYVDVKSTELTKWKKITSLTSGSLNPVLLRAFIGSHWGRDYSNLSDTYLAFAWDASTPLFQCDISFYDENGDPLYTVDGFSWQISLVAEL